jgi:predicted alpha/beta hydrolase
MVACSTGSLALLPGRFRWLATFMMHVFIPVTTALLGYTPARIVGWGEDLPAGVAREWASWCKSDRYLAGDFGRTIERQYYSEVQSPIFAIGMSDDLIANRRTIPALLALYNASRIDTRWVQPSELGQQRMGHHGFFMSRGRPLWDSALTWLRAQE